MEAKMLANYSNTARKIITSLVFLHGITLRQAVAVYENSRALA